MLVLAIIMLLMHPLLFCIKIIKIKKIIDKKVLDAIVESLLVLDASQGQNGLKQAKSVRAAFHLEPQLQ